MPADGNCRPCGSRTGYILNVATGRHSSFIACEHCDSGCKRTRCQRCSQMNHPVRIIKKPEGGDAAAGPM